jgi:hypothetical protein
MRKADMIAGLVEAEAKEFHTNAEEQQDRTEALNLLSRDDIRDMYTSRVGPERNPKKESTVWVH